jgi:hypothetical protein
MRVGYFALLTAERINGNRTPSWERLSLLVSLAVMAVLIAVPEPDEVAAFPMLLPASCFLLPVSSVFFSSPFDREHARWRLRFLVVGLERLRRAL